MIVDFLADFQWMILQCLHIAYLKLHMISEIKNHVTVNHQSKRKKTLFTMYSIKNNLPGHDFLPAGKPDEIYAGRFKALP